MDQENRVVVLIDMDCFYCQVEEKLNPELKGQPIAVVQYNPWKGGGIIAVNYVARARGVTRHMRGDEAKEKCPEIQLPSVPCNRGKANISKYRDAGIEVAKVLQTFTPLLERASIDEAYLDITIPVRERLKTLNINSVSSELMPNTFALGYDSIDEFISDVLDYGNDSIDFDYEHAKQLLIGAVIVSEIRAAVFTETGYTCSAGIAHNKILAKLVCGMNKPNKQTVLPKHTVNLLYKTLPVKKVKHLGGKFGVAVCEALKITNMAELQHFSERDLQTKFDEKNGSWLYNIARGIDLEPVQAKFNPKSIGCCKNFKGKSALLDLENLRKWLKDLGDEIEDRLEKDAIDNNRSPKQMVASFSTQLPDGRSTSSSRSYNFVADDELCGELFSNKAFELIMESAEGSRIKDGETNRKLKAPITFLGISVGKFEDHSENKKSRKIMDFFGAGCSKDVLTVNNKNETLKETENLPKDKKKTDKDYIMQKFFQVTDKVLCPKTEIKIQETKTEQPNKNTLESTLNKQESFFAKFLKKSVEEVVRPTTPVCNIVTCGDDSNDTEYSGSTIDMEINKSIALFEDDPETTERVSSMRNLLNNSTINANEKEPTEIVQPEPTLAQASTSRLSPENVEMFDCPECGKKVSIDMLDTHADYHLALKLRDEERQQVRNEIKQKSNQKIAKSNEETSRKKPVTPEQNRNENTLSIASFLVKVNHNTPMEKCSECGKRIPVEKYTEHLDFHEAQKLNRELNKKPAPVTTVPASAKRKRAVSPVKKPKMPCKSIQSFFGSNR